MNPFAKTSSNKPRFCLVRAHALLFLAAMLIAPFAINAEEATSLRAEDGFGVGVVLGSPSGLSGSLPMGGGSRAIHAAIGYDIGRGPSLFVQADHVWFLRDLFEIEQGKLALYYGPGAFAVASARSAIGIRFVGGLEYRFEGMPLQIFIEAGPGINILPDTSPAGSGGLGLRYFF